MACLHYLLLTDEAFVPLRCHNVTASGLTTGHKQMP